MVLPDELGQSSGRGTASVACNICSDFPQTLIQSTNTCFLLHLPQDYRALPCEPKARIHPYTAFVDNQKSLISLRSKFELTYSGPFNDIFKGTCTDKFICDNQHSNVLELYKDKNVLLSNACSESRKNICSEINEKVNEEFDMKNEAGGNIYNLRFIDRCADAAVNSINIQAVEKENIESAEEKAEKLAVDLLRGFNCFCVSENGELVAAASCNIIQIFTISTRVLYLQIKLPCGGSPSSEMNNVSDISKKSINNEKNIFCGFNKIRENKNENIHDANSQEYSNENDEDNDRIFSIQQLTFLCSDSVLIAATSCGNVFFYSLNQSKGALLLELDLKKEYMDMAKHLKLEAKSDHQHGKDKNDKKLCLSVCTDSPKDENILNNSTNDVVFTPECNENSKGYGENDINHGENLNQIDNPKLNSNSEPSQESSSTGFSSSNKFRRKRKSISLFSTNVSDAGSRGGENNGGNIQSRSVANPIRLAFFDVLEFTLPDVFTKTRQRSNSNWRLVSGACAAISKIDDVLSSKYDINNSVDIDNYNLKNNNGDVVKQDNIEQYVLDDNFISLLNKEIEYESKTWELQQGILRVIVCFTTDTRSDGDGRIYSAPLILTFSLKNNDILIQFLKKQMLRNYSKFINGANIFSNEIFLALKQIPLLLPPNIFNCVSSSVVLNDSFELLPDDICSKEDCFSGNGRNALFPFCVFNKLDPELLRLVLCPPGEIPKLTDIPKERNLVGVCTPSGTLVIISWSKRIIFASENIKAAVGVQQISARPDGSMLMLRSQDKIIFVKLCQGTNISDGENTMSPQSIEQLHDNIQSEIENGDNELIKFTNSSQECEENKNNLPLNESDNLNSIKNNSTLCSSNQNNTENNKDEEYKLIFKIKIQFIQQDCVLREKYSACCFSSHSGCGNQSIAIVCADRGSGSSGIYFYDINKYHAVDALLMQLDSNRVSPFKQIQWVPSTSITVPVNAERASYLTCGNNTATSRSNASTPTVIALDRKIGFLIFLQPKQRPIWDVLYPDFLRLERNTEAVETECEFDYIFHQLQLQDTV